MNKGRLTLYSILLVVVVIFCSLLYYLKSIKHYAILDFNDEGQYNGEIQAGTFNGYGKFSNTADVTYEGQWVNGNMEGYGKMTFANGSTYEGEFSDGFYEGYGKISYPNGKIVLGEWKKGKKVH